MGWPWSNLSAAPVGDADGFVVSVDMKVGAYTLAATAPTSGARHVTLTRTVVGGADTAGTIVVAGTDLSGQAITETLTPGANGILVTGTKFFATVTSITGVGWVTATGNDTIVVGWDNVCAVRTGSGVLHAIVVNTTAAGAITVADASGTIAVLPANVAVGTYVYDVNYSGFLRVEPAAASNVTIVASGSMPQTYAMA
jgi:hypothetical protein